MNVNFFRLCKKAASKSNYETHKLGAIIVKNGKPVSVGWNKKTTHPLSTYRFQNQHAEFHAIIKSPVDVSGATIYLYREDRDGNLATSKPCSICEEFLRQKNIKRVVYTTYNGYEEMTL